MFVVSSLKKSRQVGNIISKSKTLFSSFRGDHVKGPPHKGHDEHGHHAEGVSDPHTTDASQVKIEFVDGDALSLPFPDSSVDVVSCICVLHHLDDPAAAVR